MSKLEMFADFHVTELDVTIGGKIIKKPKHVSCRDWLAVWETYEDGYADGYDDAQGRKRRRSTGQGAIKNAR